MQSPEGEENPEGSPAGSLGSFFRASQGQSDEYMASVSDRVAAFEC